ncbi:MAG: diacylglycerol kinase family protein [Nanoarchaeota archaeon]
MTKISLKNSVLCATRGLFRGISSERSIKIQLLISAVIIIISLVLNISKIYLITIIIVCFLVIILELFNRGFEKLIDLISPEYNKEFGKVKDAIAGVVLLTFTMAMIVSLLILYSPVINLLKEISEYPPFLFLLIISIILNGIILLTYHIKTTNRQT